MTTFASVVVPARPPRPPQVTLLGSALAISGSSDPSISAPTDAQMAELPPDLQAELVLREAAADEQWVRGFTYAPEQNGRLWLRDRCDSTTIDEPEVPAPSGLVVTKTASGGTLAAVAHQYQIVFVNANGHTDANAAVSVTNALNDANVLTWDETDDDGTYSVYGRVSGSMGLLVSGLSFGEGETPTWTDTGSATPGAAVPGSNTTAGPGIFTNIDNVIVIPFLMQALDNCSAFGWEERDPKGRAQRWLENGTPAAIGREFWGGYAAQANSYPNDYLTNTATCDDITPGTVPSVDMGHKILQDYIASTGFGAQGMIHCQPQTAPSLLGSRRNGDLLLDIFDNVIVPDAGYTGLGPGNTDPGAGYAYIYATNLVSVAVQKNTQIFPDSYAEALDRGQNGEPNTITFYAEKFGAAFFDGSVHACCKVQLPT